MDKLRFFLAVTQYIHQYGLNASVQAAKTADRLLVLGDLEGFNLWMRIGRAIEDKQVMAARGHAWIAN